MKHVCRKGGKPIGPLDGPAWAAPGEVVKLADEENWGRVALLWRCCHTYEVRVEEVGEQEAGTRLLGPDGLEDAWGGYPASLPPQGYPVPHPLRQGVVNHWPGR